ncbi:MAG: twin-arginine translocase TatA/TatE family subunit [Lewinella sp.]|nr:twin-arginine translocase TatA/TatE family subunit [Lewinella sp.]
MTNLLLFNFLGPEMLVIFFAILLLFGGRKIPELMRGIGKGISEFNAARSSLEGELKEGMREKERAERAERAERERLERERRQVEEQSSSKESNEA